jgi:hypothetical protein
MSNSNSIFKYKIYRWDAVMTASNDRPAPMIYIKPDLKLLEFLRSNDFKILVKINNTGIIYDGKYIWGVVDKSSNMPNCRPNFDKETGFYVVTLDSFWYGYPKVGKEGDMTIEMPQVYPVPTKDTFLANSDSDQDPDQKPDKISFKHKFHPNTFDKFSRGLLLVILLLLIIFAIQQLV